MGLSPTQLATLKTELQTDPRGYGYNAAARNDTDMADKLRLVRDGSAGTVPANPTAAGGSADGKITRFKTSVPQADVIGAIDGRDIGGITQGQAAYLNAVLCFTDTGGQTKLVLATQAGAKTLLRQNLDRLLADTNGSQTRLDALAVRFGSRAEELFGTDTVVTVSDVGSALTS